MTHPLRWTFCAALAIALAGAAGQRPTETRPDPEGELVYLHNCMDCHQDGQGVPGTAPPLDGAPWVVGAPDIPIRIVLNGLVGEIVVDGERYNGVMPGWRNLLSNEEIAAVLTYIRSTWSNDARPVRPAEVDSLRALTADRAQPWTVEEIEALAP